MKRNNEKDCLDSKTFNDIVKMIKILGADHHPCSIEGCKHNENGICVDAPELGKPLPCQEYKYADT